jgi:murein DD-endopeptidase MepM/ murein hydrolase activator NlpD
MASRPWILTGALVAAIGVARPAAAQAPAPTPTPWSWESIATYSRTASVEAFGWIQQAPEMALTAGARLQMHIRNLALESQVLLAQLVPFAPFVPDLTPLVASPVPGVESSGFGWRRDPMRHSAKFHKGTDFAADRGTPVYAAGAGLVAFTGRQHGYGNVIYIDHGGGVVTRYAHLNRIETHAGAPILAGVRIGQVGATGRATGPHLHFEVRIGGLAVDPAVAMHVGELQRTDPSAALTAALELAPEAQEMKVDRHDPVKPRRPERRGAPKRERALW